MPNAIRYRLVAFTVLLVMRAAAAEEPVRHSFFVAGPTLTGIIDEAGKVEWDARRPGARDGWVLPNGNVLVAWADEVVEFGKDRQRVFTYKLSPLNREIGTAQRLENGRTLITELGAKPRLMEIDGEGRAGVEVALQPETDNAHMQTRMARKLANGNYLVPHLLAFAVKEYSPDGKVVSVIRTDAEQIGGRKAENWPFTAIRLENGHTVIGCTHGNKVIETDRSGKIIWSAGNEDVAGRPFKDACGIQRLPNGNTVIASYAAQDGIKLFEITPERKVVWSYDGPHRVHHFQILTANGKPLDGPALK